MIVEGKDRIIKYEIHRDNDVMPYYMELPVKEGNQRSVEELETIQLKTLSGKEECLT